MKKGYWIALIIGIFLLVIFGVIIGKNGRAIEKGTQISEESEQPSEVETQQETEREVETETQQETEQEAETETQQETEQEVETETQQETEQEVETEQSSASENKIIYLTFDDGPGPYTQELLDLLDKYNVKATFFVTAQWLEYKYLIQAEKEKGHTVAVHTYHHKYKEIYKSKENFLEDFWSMNEIVKEQSGEYAWLQRFPGGSSNGYTRRIEMFIETLKENGIEYCDWNVDSRDSSGTLKSCEISKNIMEGIKKKEVSIVLQHDIYQESVKAVEEVIKWGLENGYTFLPITKDTEMVHHK